MLLADSFQMKNSPLVSVIMNCYNGERFLKDALDSVFNQSYQNWEIIFWDNCSDDQSVNIASTYGPKVKIYSSNSNTSLGKARSQALKKANGEWLAFLDVDDIWMPNKLSAQLDGLIGTDSILSYAGINEVDENLKKIKSLYPRWSSGMQLLNQLRYFEINLVSSMVKRDILVDLGIDFSDQMEASEEYNLFMRILPHGRVYVCKEILALYRVYAESLTYKKMERWSIERRITLSQLLDNLPELSESQEFKIAHRQADYYEACFLMSKKEYSMARTVIKKHIDNFIYQLLYFISFFPFLWKFIHNPVVKKKLTSLIQVS